MTRDPLSDTASAPTPALVEGDRLGEQAALKDRGLDVAAGGITIADAGRPDRPPGGRLYSYTGGVIEALNAHEEDFGQARSSRPLPRSVH